MFYNNGLRGEPASDEFTCLQICKSDTDCQWLTFFPDGNYCELLENCQKLDTSYCLDCLSSQRECTPDEPVCFVEGECKGIVEGVTSASTTEECLQLCNSVSGCRWFTFDSEVSKCILLKTCPTIDESCKECISGERRCLETSTSTSATTTQDSTTSAPMPSGEHHLSN
jgi:hypothetical protein